MVNFHAFTIICIFFRQQRRGASPPLFILLIQTRIHLMRWNADSVCCVGTDRCGRNAPKSTLFIACVVHMQNAEQHAASAHAMNACMHHACNIGNAYVYVDVAESGASGVYKYNFKKIAITRFTTPTRIKHMFVFNRALSCNL